MDFLGSAASLGGLTQEYEGDEGLHRPQSVSQAARKKLTRSRAKLGTSFRRYFASSPVRARISIGINNQLASAIDVVTEVRSPGVRPDQADRPISSSHRLWASKRKPRY